MIRRIHRLAFTALATAVELAASHATAETNSPAAILQELKNFRETGRVLYIAAHPDDEDTQLITYLARARHYRTAYLSITRGDGGQNVIGPEFDSELGVIRTQELLAARRLDGGEQFFTRALDFGYSKNYQETLKIWDKEQVLSDVVRVIRTFQPDVVIAGFAPQQTPGNHGHHVASAYLAVDAFKLAGDTNAFPDQLTYLKPWQPKRLLQNQRFGGRSGGGNPSNGPHLEISGTDPVLGISYGEIAGRSRAMHKSQGFGNFGGGGGGGTRTANFLVLGGESTTNDILDGVDTTWARIPGGTDIGKYADEIISQFNPQSPVESAPALLKLYSNLLPLKLNDRSVAYKIHQISHILQSCLAIAVQTTVPHTEVVPGETLEMDCTVRVDTDFPLKWLGVQFPTTAKYTNVDERMGSFLPEELFKSRGSMPHNITAQTHRKTTQILPAKTLLSQPYWLREEPSSGMFHVSDPKLIGQAEEDSLFPVCYCFQVGTGRDSQGIVIQDQLVQSGTESGDFESRRTVKIIPPVSLHCENEVKLFAPGSAREISVAVTSARADTKGELSLDAPAGWKISPATQPFSFAASGEKKTFSFTITAPPQAASAQITARAKIGDKIYSTDRVEINYPHIPLQLLQPPARFKAVSFDLAVRAKRIGYVPGAGDSVADALKEMGCDVTMLTGADLTTNRLKDFDTVVIGIRAFNVRTDLVPHLPDLFAFAENGGTVIEQYNRPGNDLKTDKFAPYSLRISGDRVTDETAAMTFLAPEHPALNTPNKITAADFDGWVQERGIYFPNQWDEHWTPILACNDPGENPMKGSLLVAQHGKGYFVYTGLDFFRELPAGVPGAYRLFANLISLGK